MGNLGNAAQGIYNDESSLRAGPRLENPYSLPSESNITNLFPEKKAILFVEDDKKIAKIALKLLIKALPEYKVFFAPSYELAEKIINRTGYNIKVAFCDHDLGQGKKTGSDLAKILQNANIKVYSISATQGAISPEEKKYYSGNFNKVDIAQAKTVRALEKGLMN